MKCVSQGKKPFAVKSMMVNFKKKMYQMAQFFFPMDHQIFTQFPRNGLNFDIFGMLFPCFFSSFNNLWLINERGYFVSLLLKLINYQTRQIAEFCRGNNYWRLQTGIVNIQSQTRKIGVFVQNFFWKSPGRQFLSASDFKGESLLNCHREPIYLRAQDIIWIRTHFSTPAWPTSSLTESDEHFKRQRKTRTFAPSAHIL